MNENLNSTTREKPRLMRRFDEWVLTTRIRGPLSTRCPLIIIENGVTLTRAESVVNSDGGLSLAPGHAENS